MSRLPTAKDMVDKWQDIALNNIKSDIQDDNSLENTLIEFAKMHVEAALKEANEKVVLTDEVCEVLQEHWFEEYIDKNSILNSYSLDNIK